MSFFAAALKMQYIQASTGNFLLEPLIFFFHSLIPGTVITITSIVTCQGIQSEKYSKGGVMYLYSQCIHW